MVSSVLLRAIIARRTQANRSTLTRTEERQYQQQINAQTRVINNQNKLVKKLQADFRITPNEVNRFVVATNRRLEAQWERQRILTERAINRISNPTIAGRLQTAANREAERRRRSILANAAKGR
jgi:hypothetical protein